MQIEGQDSKKWAMLAKVVSSLAEFQYEWAICGGWAVDLWLGEVTRTHKDVDILVRPENLDSLCSYLFNLGWEVTIWKNGRILTYHPGHSLIAVHSIWAKGKNGRLPNLDIFSDEAIVHHACQYIDVLDKKIPVLNLVQLMQHKAHYGGSHFDDDDLEKLDRQFS